MVNLNQKPWVAAAGGRGYKKGNGIKGLTFRCSELIVYLGKTPCIENATFEQNRI